MPNIRVLNTKISIRFKLVFLTAFVLFFAIIVSNLAIYAKGRHILQEQIFSDLSAIAKSRADQIALLVEQDFENTALIASRTQLRIILMDLEKSGIDHDEKRNQMVHILQDAKRAVPVIRNIDIVDFRGITAASTMADHIGRNDSGAGWFQNGRKGKYMDMFHHKPGFFLTCYALPLSHPFPDMHNVVGVIKIDMHPDRLLAALSDYTGLGKTGELVLFSTRNDKIFFINPLRHQSDTALTTLYELQSDESMNIRNAITGEKGVVHTPDYRGVDTLMAYVPVPIREAEWGLMAKIDVQEAFSSLEALQKETMFLGGLLFLLGILSVMNIANYITEPIKNLLVGTEKLGKGDLDYRVEVTGRDEISELASSFNVMAEKIQKMESSLREKTTIAQTFMDAFPCVTLLLKTGSREIVALNRTAMEAGARLGSTCFGSWPKLDCPCWFCRAPIAWESRLPEMLEVEFSGVFWEAHWVPVTDDLYLHYALDITERKKAEANVQAALKEKEILLKEIHHRVKNNMQVVTSLMNLQAAKTPNKLIKDAFLDAQSRVQSMAIVHEILYRSQNIMEINLQSYIEKLVKHLLQAFSSRINRVDFKIDAGELAIGIDQASPCGLILNELITNALKYAFPPDNDGVIQIMAACGPDDKITMVVADNGIGLPQDIDPSTSETLGLRLVIRLIEDQLGGIWWIDRDNGTCWTIQWPVAR